MLAREMTGISVGDIIFAAQGPIVPVQCLAEKPGSTNGCSMIPSCVTRHIWAETQKLLVDYFNSVSIADLCALARTRGISRDLDHPYLYVI